MEEIVIYEKPTCSKCRAALEILNQEGVPFRTVRYHDEPLTEQQLAALIEKLGVAPRELLRTNEPAYKEHVRDTLTDKELIALMVRYPALMQRPILERGNRAIIGRPTQRILPFLAAA